MYLFVNASFSSTVETATEAAPHENVRPYEVALAAFQEFLRSQGATLEGAPPTCHPAAGEKGSAGEKAEEGEEDEEKGGEGKEGEGKEGEEETAAGTPTKAEKTGSDSIGHWRIMKILSDNSTMQLTSSSSSSSSSSQNQELIVIIDFVPAPDEKRESEFFKEIIQAFDKIISVSVGRIMVSDALNIAKQGNKLVIIPQGLESKISHLNVTKDEVIAEYLIDQDIKKDGEEAVAVDDDEYEDEFKLNGILYQSQFIICYVLFCNYV